MQPIFLVAISRKLCYHAQMKLEELFESPQNTFITNFVLDDRRANALETKKLLDDSRKIPLAAFKNGTHTLYEIGHKFLLVDHTNPNIAYTVYYMKFEVKFNSFLDRQVVQQVMVWADPINSNSEGSIPKHIFFEYLLPRYKTIITDSQQTEDGQRFWGRRVANAFDKGLFVYYVNLLPNREIVQIKTVQEFKMLAQNKEIWGDEQKHQARRIVIASTPIAELAELAAPEDMN